MGPCRARDGCKASKSVSGASVAQLRCDASLVCWLNAFPGAWLVARVALLACFGGLAFVVCAFGGCLL